MPLAVETPREPLYPADESTASSRRCAPALRRARNHRPHRRRQRTGRVQGSSTGPTLVVASRISGAIRSASLPITASSFSESALKAAHFIELCAQRGVPLVFLQNITGFMVGRKYENAGIAKDGAKMVTAVATAGCRKFNRDHRRQLWRGQLRDVRARLRPAVLVDVAERADFGDGRRAGRLGIGPGAGATAWRHAGRTGAPTTRPRSRRNPGPVRKTQGHPYYASARLWDDGIIDPAETRLVLALSLSAALNAPIEPTKFGVFRM